MSRSSRTWRIAALLWLSLVPCNAERTPVRVRLQSYVDLSRGTLNTARQVASTALQQAGVQLVWVDCLSRGRAVSADPVCHEPLTPLALEVRIIGKRMAKRAGRSSRCMGYALVSGEVSSIAAVYHHRAAELEGASYATPGTILGALIAHEIGHLLGIGSHSRQGLMSTSWGGPELKAMAKGQFGFTADQARQITGHVAARARLGTPVTPPAAF